MSMEERGRETDTGREREGEISRLLIRECWNKAQSSAEGNATAPPRMLSSA